jgi:hypothetical protein
MSTTAARLQAPTSVGLALRPDIVGLRMVGVVVLFHSRVPRLPGGYVGVGVLFVIRFLMIALLMNQLS